MTEIPLSVVIIAFNEEASIARCIESVLPVADEILVLDSGSADKTSAIARSLGARVEQHPFDGHIQQKNRAISMAKFSHILSLDADEALDAELQKAIKQVKKNWEASGYTMNRLNRYCGQWLRHSGWYPDTKIRLADSRLGSWKGTNPHDRYELNPGEKTKHLPGNILHYTIDSLSDHIRQENYFSDIAAKAYFEKGRRSNAFKMLLNPWAKFMRNYFFRRGFLDGRMGFQVCLITAFSTYLKYAKLAELQRAKSKSI